MSRFRKYLPGVVAALVGAAMLAAPNQAQAVFQMRISSTVAGPGGTLLITDGGVGDVNPLAGAITFVGSIGNFSLTVNTGETKPFIGSATTPHMDLNFQANSAGSDTLTIEISDQGFLTSPLPMNTSIGGTLSGAIASVKAEATFDNTNTLFGGTAPPGYSQTFTSSPISGVGGFTITGGTPYSLTQRIIITATGQGGLTSGDFELQAAPAPAGLVLALTGMPVLGLGAWLRRRRTLIAA